AGARPRSRTPTARAVERRWVRTRRAEDRRWIRTPRAADRQPIWAARAADRRKIPGAVRAADCRLSLYALSLRHRSRAWPNHPGRASQVEAAHRQRARAAATLRAARRDRARSRLRA